MPTGSQSRHFLISHVLKFVSDFGFRISSFALPLLLALVSPASAGTIETFDGITATGPISLDTGGFVIKGDGGATVKVDPAEILRAQFSDSLPGENFMPGVILRNGTRIAGQFGSLTEAQVRFEKRGLSVPGAEIAWVIYQPVPAAAAAKAPVGKTGALLPGNDFFEGTIKAADDKSAKLLNPIFGPRTFLGDRRELLALILRDPRPSAALFEVRTKDGSLFGVDAMSIDKTGVTLKHPLYDGVKLEPKDIVEIRAGTARYLPLTTRKPARVDPLPGRKLEQCFAVDKTITGELLDSFGASHGRGFESALGVPATWDVPAGFNAINVLIAVPPGVPPVNRLIFAIYADGRPLARSGQISSADKPVPLHATLANVRSISFRVEAGFPTNATGSGLWLEPTLLRK